MVVVYVIIKQFITVALFTVHGQALHILMPTAIVVTTVLSKY